MPKVSVIIPTYNRTDYLKTTLENLQKQTFRDFEVIVVDDGTPGEANKLVCSNFNNVRYHRIANSGGPMRPRNTGFKLAESQYIALVDDDDLWLPDKLEKQVAILDKNEDFGLVHSYCLVIDHEGNQTGETVGRLSDPLKKHGYVFDEMVGSFTVMTPTAIFRKELLSQCGTFNENMKAAGEDTEFFSRMAFYTKFYYIDEPTAYYRVHPQGISGNRIAYLKLPLELFRMLKGLKNKESLSNKRFGKIRKRLLLKQVSMIYDSLSLKTSIKNCFSMHLFFWLIPVVSWGILLKMKEMVKPTKSLA